MTLDAVPLIPARLAQHARTRPDARAYVFLSERGEEKDALTYAQVHAGALEVAGKLAGRCAPGDRALLVFPQGLEFVLAFLGCLYAGVVAVPVNPPRRTRMPDATRSVVLDCAPTALLAPKAGLDPMADALEPICGPLHRVAVDLHPPAAATAEPHPVTADTLAFLQYTSGSTAAPKGVMVTHGNLAANEEMIQASFGHDEHSVVLGWVPFFHDTGLIGQVLQPLHLGTLGVLMAPMTFLRRPLQWLSAISAHRAHTAGGPNFGYELCVDHATRFGLPEVDLSCWKVAFNGAEPIRPDTLRRFAETFAPVGFDARALFPCYGLAEATLIVTGSGKGRGPRFLDVDPESLAKGVLRPGRTTLAGSGVPLPGEHVRIVDPTTCEPLPDGRIGEVWVSGPHVAAGYWRRPAVTAATFHAECPDEPGRRYLRTGDLGALYDGELHVVGRLKDLIIIRGRNLYPQDIEATVAAAHPALRPGCGAAFAVPDPTGERLVVVQEVHRDHRDADPREVGESVRAALAREHQLTGELVLTTHGQVQLTSSGKIMRRAARDRHLGTGFPAWTGPATIDR